MCINKLLHIIKCYTYNIVIPLESNFLNPKCLSFMQEVLGVTCVSSIYELYNYEECYTAYR